MKLSDEELATLYELYPYERSREHHPLACLFFNGPVKVDVEVADQLAKHVFERLDCSPPREPDVKYDALGGSGAPWESGAWIKADKERVAVEVTVQEKPVSEMDDAELAALRRDLNAADDARRAGTLKKGDA